MRSDGRANNELRSISFTRQFTIHPRGSVLVAFGNTEVLCTASVTEQVPRWLRGTGHGWITAEYGMLPGSTHTRFEREATRGKQSGRTQEIQRLIGRSLRASLDLALLGEVQLIVDCDVLQADGGTRTASITGGMIALTDAINSLLRDGVLTADPIRQCVAAVSVGMYQGQPILDLDYLEDSNAESDFNIVMADGSQIVEVQGTAEAALFSRNDLDAMLDLGDAGICKLIDLQKRTLYNN